MNYINDLCDVLFSRKMSYAAECSSELQRDWIEYSLGLNNNGNVGSQIRGITVLAIHGVTEKSLKIALALELLHNTSLIVDDVIDRHSVRRGKDSFWKKYGRSAAMLSAHWLNEDANILFFDGVGANNHLEIFFDTKKNMLHAEISGIYPCSASGYIRYSGFKTGGIFGLISAISDQSNNDWNSVLLLLKDVGISHQIYDDMLDYDLDRSSKFKSAQQNFHNLSYIEQNKILEYRELCISRLKHAYCQAKNPIVKQIINTFFLYVGSDSVVNKTILNFKNKRI